MKKLLIIAATLFASHAAFAATCEEMAVSSKDGKPLHGAAKAASIKKCEADKGTAGATATATAAAPVSAGSDCAAKALSKDGKKLAGAAKTAFMKKCEADANAAK